jgi:hypothetical protein
VPRHAAAPKMRSAAIPEASARTAERSFFGAGLLLLAAAALAVLAAWHPFATVTSRPGGRFQDPDAAFHARRAERAIQAGGVLPPVFDAFENFPEGGRAVWPPLHDATLALLARLGGSTRQNPARGMSLAAALPVVQLVVSLLTAAGLAAAVSGLRGGVAAAFLFASMPTVVERGAFGEIDHNMTEVLGALLLLLLAQRLPGANHAAGGGFRRWLAPVLWAAAVLLALGFHAGLVLSAGIVAAAIAVSFFFEERGENASLHVLPSLAAGFAVAALVLPVFAGLRTRPDPADPWRLGPVYVLILSAAAVGTGAFSLFPLLRRKAAGLQKGERRAAALAAGAILVAPVLFALAPRAAWGGLWQGLGFIGAHDRWLSSIQEFQPVWTNPDVLRGVLPGLLVASVALVAAAAARPSNEKAARLAALAFVFGVFTVLAVFQQRFFPPAAAFSAVAGGAAVGLIRARVPRLLVGAAFAAGLGFAGPISFRSLAATFRKEADLSLSAAETAAAVLKEATPEPGDPPAWGVLAPWDFGHAILRDSGRAVAMNNFGSWHPGFAGKLGLLVETSPRRAVSEMFRLHLRYVVVPYPPPVVYGVARALGRSPLDFLVDDGEKTRVRYLGTPLGERTLLFRLHKRNGLPLPDDTAEDREALRHFRKIWESPEGEPETGPFLKIFELGESPP